MAGNIIGYLILAWKIFIRPWTSPETLWLVLPLVLILLLIHLYFGRHRTEELGWNSAFGNSISLLWVCVILFRFLFSEYKWAAVFFESKPMKSLIIIGVLTLWVLLLLAFNFFHVMPKRLAFVLSSSDSLYILAYIIISVIIGDFALNMKTLIAAIILFIIMLAALQLIKHLIPMTQSAKQVKKARKEKKKKEKAGKKAAKAKEKNKK
jgi:hypothetical protein